MFFRVKFLETGEDAVSVLCHETPRTSLLPQILHGLLLVAELIAAGLVT